MVAKYPYVAREWDRGEADCQKNTPPKIVGSRLHVRMVIQPERSAGSSVSAIVPPTTIAPQKRVVKAPEFFFLPSSYFFLDVKVFLIAVFFSSPATIMRVRVVFPSHISGMMLSPREKGTCQ